GEVALLLGAGRLAQDARPEGVVTEQDPSVPPDVLEREVPGHPHDEPLGSPGGDRPEGAIAADLRSGEPDLASVRRPGEDSLPRQPLRQRGLLPGEIAHRNGPAVVPAGGMVHERDDAAFRRDAHVGEPAGRVVEDLPDGSLDPAASRYVADDGEA